MKHLNKESIDSKQSLNSHVMVSLRLVHQLGSMPPHIIVCHYFDDGFATLHILLELTRPYFRCIRIWIAGRNGF